MKNSLNLLKAAILLLVSGMASADMNLAITFENADTSSNYTCVPVAPFPVPSGSNPSPFAVASGAFWAVITNVGSKGPVTIKAVTFTGVSAPPANATTIDANTIIANSDNAFERAYLLQSCNGKKLAQGASCKIPLLFTYPGLPVDPPYQPITIAMTAVTDDPSLPPPSSNSLTIDLSNEGGLVTTLYNIVNNSSYSAENPQSGATLPTANNQANTLISFSARHTPTIPAVLQYTVTNNSSVAKTIGTRCRYDRNTILAPYIQLASSVVDGGQCDNISLAPGKTCTSPLEIMPNTLDSEADMWIYAFDASAPVRVPSGLKVLSAQLSGDAP